MLKTDKSRGVVWGIIMIIINNNNNRNQLRGDVLKRMRQNSCENETEAICQKCDTQISDKIVCSGCKLYV